jgi:serine/threonine protein kinase
LNIYFKFSFLLLTIIINWLANMNVTALHASQSLYKVNNTESDFQKNYILLNQIGKGTHSTVFLSKNSCGELVAVKKYAISDESVIALLKKTGINVATFIEQLAQKELHIGQLTDHPNIVKIREVFFENCTAYVVMDYVEGQTFNCFEKYPSDTRVTFMRQFLSAIEHFLLRNIIIDDLWSENILISSNGTHLTLVNLGGNEIIGNGAEMPVGHYLEMIENMLVSLGSESAKALDNCKHFLPTTLREETISPAHVRVLIYWIEALQQELFTPLNLNNTLSEDSADNVLTVHTQLQSQHPNHISFNTAQHSRFLAYSLIAANVLKKFSPGKYSDAYLQNTHILRYPCEHLPKSLEDLFQLLPMRDDYDTASSLVGDALISVSPSLKEKESEESAWGIFENNERKGSVADYTCKFFESERVSPIHFRSQIKAIVKEAPKSNEGLIYNFFIPKDAPLYKAIYLSQPYGIPIGNPLSQNNLLNFYEQYGQGLVEEENSQLRFLPSALIPENGFDLKKVKSYRFTTIPSEQLDAYTQKIEKVVSEIFKNHLEEMLQLAALASDVEMQPNLSEQQKGYQELCYRHLCRRDIKLALYYWYKIDDENLHKFSYLPGIINCLLNKNQLIEAHYYFEQHESKLIHKEQLIARFALAYIERDNRAMLDSMLKKLSDSNIKKFILVVAGSRYPEYAQENIPENLESLMSDDELINLAQPLN